MSVRGSYLLVVDIGNSRTKFGFYELPTARTGNVAALSEPRLIDTSDMPTCDWTYFPAIESWIDSLGQPSLVGIGSVHRSAGDHLTRWASERFASARVRRLTHRDFSLQIDVAFPDRVGIDRLAGAAAANQLRSDGQPAVVVDLGTAITVDRVTAEGAFAGGAILPGLEMSGRALNAQTDQLPMVLLPSDSRPSPLGKSTEGAIQAGLFWGAVGAVRELIAQFGHERQTQVFFTGGAAAQFTPLFSEARHVPHLVLDGIAATTVRIA